jgi:broad specificity phosphatase PhoE
MKELVLIRHGSSFAAGERYIGRTDTSLTPTGREQAESICHRLAAMQIDAIYASPLSRARETLSPLLQLETSRHVVLLPDLQEIDFGHWEGLSFEEIQAQAPECVAEWAKGSMDFSFPGGESLELFWRRVCQVGDHLRATSEASAAVVTHGGVIRYLICYYLGLPPEKHRCFQVDLGSLTTLTFSEGVAVLKGLNDHG